MKKIAFACGTTVAIAALVLALGAPQVFGATKRTPVTKTGEVVGLWCYIDHGGHGADHKACAQHCVESGNPIGLLTEQGDLYLLMGAKKHQPGSAVALDKMADTVTVSGDLIKKGGLQAIYVKEIK